MRLLWTTGIKVKHAIEDKVKHATEFYLRAVLNYLYGSKCPQRKELFTAAELMCSLVVWIQTDAMCLSV